MKHSFFFLLCACLYLGCSTTKPSPSATLVLLNGNFFTADTLCPRATAVAVHGDTIMYVGDNAGARALAGPATEILDLAGAFAMPGFIEGHGHFAGLGKSLENLNLMGTAGWNEIVDLVAKKAKITPAGAWIEGRGWHQEKWTSQPDRTVNGYPYHDALSAVTPDHPVVLRHASGHGLIANAKAMELAGVSRETPDPLGGRVVRDASGNLTGVFEENAMDLIDVPLDAWTNQRSEAEKQAAFDKTAGLAARECLAKGITSFQDAGSSFWEIEQYERLAKNGRLPVRLWVMIAQPKAQEYSRLADFPKVGLGNGHLTVRAVKAYLDGALGSYGAWLTEPYTDKPGHFGQNTTPVDSIRSLARECRKYSLQLCVHAIGDRANHEVLNICEEILSPSNAPERPSREPRWRIEHAQHLNVEDIPRFRTLGIIAAMQAIHCTSDAPFVVKRLGEDRARSGAYAWRSLLDAGAHLANGTDTPVEDADPLPCLYAAVTRKQAGAGAAFFPEQKMTREEALYSYTLWNAYAAFEEREKGSIKPGKRADIVVLSEDLLHCTDEKILMAKVLRTIVGGQTRFVRAENTPR